MAAQKNNNEQPNPVNVTAYNFAAKWVSDTFGEFISQDIIEAFEAEHEPFADNRSFGPIMARLKKEGLIISHGFGKFKSKTKHGKVCETYISKAYSDQQSKNSKGKIIFAGPSLFDKNEIIAK